MHSKRRQLTAWSGLFILTINLIAGALMPAQAAAPAGQLAQQAYICTAFGLKAINADDGQGDSSQAAAHAAFCVYCLPLLQGGLDAPPTPALAGLPGQPPLFLGHDGAEAIFSGPSASHNPAAPRAPPIA